MKKIIILGLILISHAATAQSKTALSYIEKYKDDAIRQMNRTGVPASIILAVAMHESGVGTSKIARYLNNHFGIKGSNTSKVIKSSYKGYPSVEASYADFIRVLQKRQFNWIFDRFTPYDYKSWAYAIQKSGYAESNQWAQKVVGMIKAYDLDQYDQQYQSSVIRNPVPAASLSPVIDSGPPHPVVNLHPAPVKEKAILNGRSYKVKAGDTLLGIASKFGTTVKKIQSANGLKTTKLKIGQVLKI